MTTVTTLLLDDLSSSVLNTLKEHLKENISRIIEENKTKKKKNTPENKLIRDKKIITCTETGLYFEQFKVCINLVYSEKD